MFVPASDWSMLRDRLSGSHGRPERPIQGWTGSQDSCKRGCGNEGICGTAAKYKRKLKLPFLSHRRLDRGSKKPTLCYILPSSADGPYTDGTGTSFMRRYTPNCARW